MSAPSLLRVALFQRCPACGKGKLFSGLLAIAEQCKVCHASFVGHEKGDGPAFFVIIVVGFVATGLAAWLELAYEPPFWVHALVWPPVILLLSIWLLRFFKALIIAVQWRHLGLR